VPAAQAAVEGADWVIDESPDNAPAQASMSDANRRKYTIDRTYPAGPLSGITWHVYRQRHSTALDTR
jgi:hypothetical protein